MGVPQWVRSFYRVISRKGGSCELTPHPAFGSSSRTPTRHRTCCAPGGSTYRVASLRLIPSAQEPAVGPHPAVPRPSRRQAAAGQPGQGHHPAAPDPHLFPDALCPAQRAGLRGRPAGERRPHRRQPRQRTAVAQRRQRLQLQLDPGLLCLR